jgi:hypothetical protein
VIYALALRVPHMLALICAGACWWRARAGGERVQRRAAGVLALSCAVDLLVGALADPTLGLAAIPARWSARAPAVSAATLAALGAILLREVARGR